jgi:hypothetical protein
MLASAVSKKPNKKVFVPGRSFLEAALVRQIEDGAATPEWFQRQESPR